ncbi:MAG TPA: hypothetical protein EYM74_00830, partial [Candidatus Marinimicrobia bacterium]|nr:hypothetical protein [Candidatus Neomarinimicrobiota bacterium]
SSSPYPDAPSGLAATAGDGSVVLTWTAHSETDVAKYGLYYGTSSGPAVKQAEVSGRTTVTTTVSDLSNNVTYYFRITAIDGDSYESGFSSEVSAAPAFSGSTIYVDNSGTEPTNPDGSESNAFYSIQAAIDAESTTNGKRVLVKAGTYTGSGSSSTPVIDLKGKNIIIESDAGPATTIIDAGGNRTALSLDHQNGEYSGYSATATKFIGITFTNGDDDNSLIDIAGPNPNNSNNSWDITFENCRFTNTTNDYGYNYAVVYIGKSSSIFDGCQFRNLNISGNFSNNNDIYAPIKIQGETSSYYDGSTWQSDTTIFRPQFKNCVIADNSVVNTASSGRSYYDYIRGGGIAVRSGAVPYFENTRIDSNTADAGGNYSDYYYSQVWGGGIYTEGRYENDPPIKFVNCSISNNVAKGTYVDGGGIYTSSAQTQFINTVITNNLAFAAYSTGNDYVNTRGGGISCQANWYQNENPNYPSNDPLTLLVNCTVANNKLKYIAASNITWGGAGIQRMDNNDPVQIMNSIIYHNTVVGEESNSGAYHKMNLSRNANAWGSQGTTIGYSFIEHADDAGVDGDEVYEYSPAFSDTANGDFSLSISSLAIGAGVSEYEDVDAPAYDYNNSARPNPAGSNPDLGAFENSLSATPYPGTPQSLTVASVGDSTVTLSWTAATEDDLIRYRIYYGTSSPATTLKDSASASATSKAVGGLTNGTEYVFRITALDGDGYESIYSNEVEGTPLYKGPVWYVDDDGSSSGEGSSNDPMREIQDAIDAAASGDTVLVLPGTYNRSGDQELQFVTPSYTAKNIVLKSRDGAATTILDGEGNKLLIEVRYATDTTLQIIGFTIKNGGSGNGGSAIRVQGVQEWNGSEYVPNYYATAIFKNCIISDNADPGYPAFWLSIAKVNFIDCIIKNNKNIKPSDYSYIDGGAGLIENGSQVIFNRCQIIDNEAEGECFTKGGALSIRHQNTDVKFINSVIARNSVTAHDNGCGARGGAFNIIWGANVTIINSTVVENTTHHSSNPSGGNQGGFVSIAGYESDYPTTLTVFNSIIDNMLAGNGTQVTDEGSETETRISYSIYTGVDADDYDEEDYVYTHTPAFIDTVGIDPSNYYQLHPRSLAIGAGASTGEDVEERTISAPTVDIAGNTRPNPAGSNPDLGAYESTLAITPYPDAPSALAGTAIHQTVSLSWTAPDEDDVVKYFVYQRDSTSSGWSSWAAADSLDSLTSTATTI